jgi:Sec-independent protein translocase protein TatA
MSAGQLLLTFGVALLVFDAKKLPKLIVNVAYLFAALRQLYQDLMGKFEQLLQQASLEKQLERNEKKAQQFEK